MLEFYPKRDMKWNSGAVSGRELDLKTPHTFRIHEELYPKEIRKIIHSLAQGDDKDFLSAHAGNQGHENSKARA